MKTIGQIAIVFILFATLVSCSKAQANGPRRDNQNDPPPPRPGTDRPEPRDKPQGGGQGYTLEQAISDRAQLNTIAFNGLAFLTGSFECDTFLPPGKVSDYFGFQYMRDVQPQGAGHNTDFLTRISNNMLKVLTDEQKAQLVALGQEQAPQFRELALKRFPMIKAFCRQLAGEIPAGSKGLDKDAVMKYASEIFTLDGQLAYRRAQVCGNILSNLSDDQKAQLAKLKFDDCSTWPDVPDQIDRRSMDHDTNVMVMTYASEMFSWYAGSVDADTYFCPERHGTYFGGFYMKDAPVMGKRDTNISTSLTGDSGEQFLKTLQPEQAEKITNIIELQKPDLNEIVNVRRSISTELRKFMTGGTADQNQVMTLSKRYGELDGELAWYYATRFAEVGGTLTPDEKAQLVKLRNLDMKPQGAFIYSEPVQMPEIPDTDFFFTKAG